MTVFSCVFFISIREKSDQRLFFFCLLDAAIYHFSLFSQTSPYLYWRRSTPPKFKGYIAWSLHIIGTSSAFVKKSVKDCVSLMVICGPQKIQMAPQNIGRGPNIHVALKITDLGTTPSLHGRMYYLPKFEAYLKRWDPQFQ